MRSLLALLVFAGCLSPLPAPAGDGRVTGTVLSVDRSPMAYDGDALIEIQTDRGRRVTVHVPARTNLCRAEGLGLVSELVPGDRVEVLGEARDGTHVTPCTSPDHRIRRVGPVGGGA